jgi:zinc finger protein 830
MADVRSLLKNERAARRIQHKYAGYSTAGSLLCLVCHLQLKSESLWEGHLRSPGHIMRVSKQQASEENTSTLANSVEGNNKKRKASDEEDEDNDALRKRTKASNTTAEDATNGARGNGSESPAKSAIPHDMQIPSRPATPMKTMKEPPKQPVVDEDEWAAFEADVAAVEVPMEAEVVISAPAMTAAEVEARSAEEENTRRKEKLEAELEGDKEDAQRKLQDEFEEMESLEERVKRLREKREALRLREARGIDAPKTEPIVETTVMDMQDEDDEDDDDEDDWDGFRLK